MKELREHYANDTRPGIHRPLGSAVPKTRYDFILDAPHTDSRSETFDRWTPDGAKVVREVVKELQMVLPTFQSRGTKHAVKRFEHFYDDLLALKLFLKDNPAGAQILDSNE
jgi:hypothetical protein